MPGRSSGDGEGGRREADGAATVLRSTSCVLFIYYRSWLDDARVEWEPMARAAATVGTTAVVSCWEDLRAEAGVASARDAFVFPAGDHSCSRVPAVQFAPTIVFTTWGYSGYVELLGEILAAGALSSEGAVVAMIDGKIELERCLRRYERTSGRAVYRPTTYLPDEPLPASDDPDRLVILKPSGGGQGKGIKIIEASEVATYQRRAADHDVAPFVVQELIGETFLADGHRWGIRLMVLITSLNPIRFVLYPEATAKVAILSATPAGRELEEWLDNDTLRVGRPGSANLPLSSMLQRLEGEHRVTFDGFWPQVRELVADIVAAIALEAQRLSLPLGRTFLYPGLDLILERGGEEDFRACLLEINSHPGQDWQEESISSAMMPMWMAWFEELGRHQLSAAPRHGD